MPKIGKYNNVFIFFLIQEENDDQDAGGMLENKNDSVIDFPDDTNNQDAETINQIESKAETVNHEYNFNDLGDK